MPSKRLSIEIPIFHSHAYYVFKICCGVARAQALATKCDFTPSRTKFASSASRLPCLSITSCYSIPFTERPPLFRIAQPHNYVLITVRICHLTTTRADTFCYNIIVYLSKLIGKTIFNAVRFKLTTAIRTNK